MDKLKDFYPSEKDIALINELKLALVPVGKEDGIVLTVLAADSQIDRSNDRFELKALKSMAKLAIQNKIPYFLSNPNDMRDHNTKSVNNRGNVFKAWVKDGQLFYKIFFPKTANNLSFLEEVVNGLHNKVSVGFGLEYKDYFCSICDKSIVDDSCKHYPGDGSDMFLKIMDVSDNYEISGAGVPAQVAASIVGKEMEEMEDDKLEVVGKEANTPLGHEALAAATSSAALGDSISLDGLDDAAKEKVKALMAELKPVKKTELEEIKEIMSGLPAALKEYIDLSTKAEFEAKKETLVKLHASIANEKSSTDKITDDTIKDNSVMEKEEVKSAEVSLADVLAAIKSVADNQAALKAEVDALKAAPVKEEPVAAAAKHVDTKSLQEIASEQLGIKPNSLETVGEKSLTEMLWDRLSAKV